MGRAASPFAAAVAANANRQMRPVLAACSVFAPYPQPRDEAIRFRAEVMEPGEDFDQTGFELPAAPAKDPAQPGLFADDFSQPNAEPVFWPAAAAQAFPPDDGVQPDLFACSAQADEPE